jgi:hypothetical protein
VARKIIARGKILYPDIENDEPKILIEVAVDIA